MTPILKRNINVIVPMAVAAYVLYKTDPKLSDPKKSLPVVLIVLVLTWIAVNQLTSYALRISQQPKPGEVPVTPDGFDYATFCKRLYDDINCLICFRDTQLYKDFASLTDAQLIAVNQFWIKNYYPKENKSLRVSINDEWTLGINVYVKSLNERFDKLKIQ